MKARTWIPILAALLLLAVTSPSRSTAEDAAAPKAMTNDDIVKMVKLGFGDDVVVAKIKEAPTVDFKTGIDDLEALKKAGASDAVISAMVARQGKAEAPPPAAAPGAEQAAVELVTKDKGTVSLTSEAGTTSTAYAYVTMLMFSNFEGQHAKVRTADRHPSLIVHSDKNPEGRFWFVSAEIDDDDNVRSVKMGNMGMFKSKNLNAPDTDNRIKCTVEQTGKDTWTYTPKKDLKKGEYGIWYSAGTAGATAPGGEMFDFGVD